ncbi:MAG: hypothetical protein Q8Q02_11385 [Nocardioides sp.]|nr:hypothetical protein [Nocardioides sp.]
MRFTEHELTVAVEAVARRLDATTRAPWSRKKAAERWDGLSKMQRYERLSAAADLVLPVLAALPERPTVGSSPAFSAEEYTAAVEQARGSAAGKRERMAVVVLADLARRGVAAMPVRRDPDAFEVPDHL